MLHLEAVNVTVAGCSDDTKVSEMENVLVLDTKSPKK